MEAMTLDNLEKLKYPIGKYSQRTDFSDAEISEYKAVISGLPSRLRTETEGLSDTQLDTPYRDGGWTIRQVVHHLADSHMNAYIRYKLALTENTPVIKPYAEAEWAETTDSRISPVEDSLRILEGLHARWARLMETMSRSDFKKTFFHPETKSERQLDDILAMYAWHSNHHLAHITGLKERKGW